MSHQSQGTARGRPRDTGVEECKGFELPNVSPGLARVPLAMGWAITMHKSQVQTVDKAVIDLGKSEVTARLTFVCLSRAKRLVDLPVGAHALRQTFQAWRKTYSKA